MSSTQRPSPRRPRTAAAARHDRRYAWTTAGLVTLVGAATTLGVVLGVVPLDLAWPGPARFAFETATYVLLFDAYFYALHRLLHTQALYRRIHVVHHRSPAPSMTTALAMHPLETLAVFAFVPVALFVIPIHLVSLAAVTVFLTTSILLAHGDWDPFPAWWARVPLVGWYVTPRVHHVHHARRDRNYGATLDVFDRLFGTLAPDPVSDPPRR